MIPEPMSSDIAEELEVSEMAILLIITRIVSLSRSTYAETVLLSLKVIYVRNTFRGVSDTSKWW